MMNLNDPNLLNEDRSPESVPVSNLNRSNYGAPLLRRNAPANFKAAIQEKAKDPENKGAQAVAPFLRFCGGASKPYKK